MAPKTAHKLETARVLPFGKARVVSFGKASPLLQSMRETLEKRAVEVEPVTLSQAEVLNWLRAQPQADIFGFDFQQYRGFNSAELWNAFFEFVFNRTYEQKLCIGDQEGLGLLQQSEQRTPDEIKKKINSITATTLAAHSQRLEDTTQHWADTHTALKRKLTFAADISLRALRVSLLRYGENPHQDAALYRMPGERFGVLTATKIQGKELSYNNINDTDAAYECVAEFDANRTAACVIVKHANPCGVAEGSDLVSAYRKALACDPTSAYGGIVALNRTLDAEAARAITEIFTEVIIAPDATQEAIELVGKRKNLRLLLAGGLPDPRAAGFTFKTVAGGLLMQTRDNAVVDDMVLKVVTDRAPTDAEMRDLRFAFRVAKHVKSNTIVYAKDLATVGIGAGQMSRVDSARIAARKAEDAAAELKLPEPLTEGSVVASDAFFPFADGLIACTKAGATAVIQPGGSIRDEDVIKAANDRNIAMVFTDVRHFRH